MSQPSVGEAHSTTYVMQTNCKRVDWKSEIGRLEDWRLYSYARLVQMMQSR